MKKNYRDEDIIKINILDILDRERERGRKGVYYLELGSILNKQIPVIKALHELKKEKLINWDEKSNLCNIIRKGRSKRKDFFENANSKNLAVFRSQRPLSYYNSVRLDHIEQFLGFFTLPDLIACHNIILANCFLGNFLL